jgi:hypothetical protein
MLDHFSGRERVKNGHSGFWQNLIYRRDYQGSSDLDLLHAKSAPAADHSVNYPTGYSSCMYMCCKDHASAAKFNGSTTSGDASERMQTQSYMASYIYEGWLHNRNIAKNVSAGFLISPIKCFPDVRHSNGK